MGLAGWLALLVVAPAVQAQTDYDELSGVLEVTADEATIEGIQLIYVAPQTGVDLDPLLAQTADNLRSMDGQKVHATGEFREGILWGVRVEPVEEEQRVPIEYFGPAAEFDVLEGTLEVTASEASIEGTRLVYVPRQSGVDVDDLLAQTAENVRALDGLYVRATGQLSGGILWSAVVQRAEEEEEEAEVEEVPQEEIEETPQENVEETPQETEDAAREGEPQ